MSAEILSFPDVMGIFPRIPLISLAGAGGKTTLMFRLAEMFPVTCVMTTTTKVGADQILAADQLLECAQFPVEDMKKKVWVSPSLEPVSGKIIGCGASDYLKIADRCIKKGFALVCEADGAARRHVKAPAAHEPVIPREINVCFYLAGLDVIGLPMNAENVHRPELFSEITGAGPDEIIRSEHLIRLFDHPSGGLKNMPEGAMRIAYLTHADTEERISAGRSIAEQLKNYDCLCMSRLENRYPLQNAGQ